MKKINYFALLSKRKNVFLAAVSGNYFEAAQRCSEVLRCSGLSRNDCINLGFLTQEYLSPAAKQSVLYKIESLNLIESDSIDALFLLISLTLQIDLEKGRKLFEELYLDKILCRSIREKRDSPLFFWHIPKCSGTSLCQTLAEKYYGRPLSEVIPGYTFSPMLKMLVQEYPDAAPFVSANQLHTHELNPSDAFTEFTILRDPLKRALSMYRQEAPTHQLKTKVKENASHFFGVDKALHLQRRHYKVLPRYRHFWDYRNDKTFEGWLESIPETLLSSQTYTFSKNLEIEEAIARIRQTCVFKIDPLPENYDDLLSKLDVGFKYQDLPNGLNASSKNVNVAKNQMAALEQRSGVDINLINQLEH